MRIRNFLFHRVSDQKDARWPPMPPGVFEYIIRYLKKNFQLVALEDYLDHPDHYSNLREMATISFDDGYKDNIELAAPLLKKYDCPASFYVVTNCIDNNIPTWTYIVDYIFQHAGGRLVELDFTYVPEKLKKIIVSTELTPAMKEIKPWMKLLSNSQRTEVLQSIQEQCRDVELPGNLMMNWKDVSELRASGFIIGSHSCTHPMLAKLETTKDIEQELSLSYQRIEEMVQVRPKTISYPVGSFNRQVMAIAKETGYSYGLAVEQKFFETKKDDLLAIPRVELYHEPKWKIHGRINGIYNTMRRLWK